MRRIATIPSMVEQHVEDAAFLWSRRRREIDGPICGDTDIGRIDQRLAANLEGLFASGIAAWELAMARLADYREASELFVVAALALRTGEKGQVDTALEAAAAIGADGVSALSGAIALTPREALKPHVRPWLDASEPTLRCVGLAALRHHRADPGTRLGPLVADDDRMVRRRAARLAAALKRRDLLPRISAGLQSTDEGERLEAASALCLLGEAPAAWPVLDRLALADADVAAPAFEMRLISTPPDAAKSWLQKQLNRPAQSILAVAHIGMLGERTIMPWLVDKMRDPDMAEAAGRALRDLFEVDFNDADIFTADVQALGEAFAGRDDLDGVPLPVADRVAAWWQAFQAKPPPARFISMRRQRLDAYRTAFADPGAPLADWRRTRVFPAWM